MNFNWDDISEVDADAIKNKEGQGRKRTSTNQRNVRRLFKGKNYERPFIAWDGEGSNLSGPDEPQHYVLFGSSVCEPLTGYQLTGHECIDHILNVAANNPSAIHISFAFNYDVNMIIHGWDIGLLRKLHTEDFCEYTLHSWDNGSYTYRIEWRKGKWFSISRKPADDNAILPELYVKIYDIFSFFQTSFVKACDKWLTEEELAPTREAVIAGKAIRNQVQDIADIQSYWQAEITQLQILAFRLREAMLAAGYDLPEWHGPGVIASEAMKKNNVKDHKIETPDTVRDAARYGYMAGHFELYQVGRWNQTVWEMDVNSAYPYFIAQLPSLTEGYWRHVIDPRELAEFGIYRIRYNDPEVITHTLRPQPFFHRDSRHNICFPGEVNGWYWSLETRFAKDYGATVIEGWEYVGWESRPFAWVAEMYAQRKQWQEDGNGGEYALKLCMNSLYGKMAQRVGWDQEGRKPPPWHQIEWAGWVTSGCRSMVFDVIRQLPAENVIAVETDAVYFAGTDIINPSYLGIDDSKELGGWGIQKWDEVMYVQNGLASLRKGDNWKTKYRGMDAGSVDNKTIERFIGDINPGEPWPSIEATTSRFVGLGLALSGKDSMRRHCKWEMNQPKSINVGIMGKRRHVDQWCPTCVNGIDAPHRMVTITPSNPDSEMHALPWLDILEAPTSEQQNDLDHWE